MNLLTFPTIYFKVIARILYVLIPKKSLLVYLDFGRVEKLQKRCRSQGSGYAQGEGGFLVGSFSLHVVFVTHSIF